MFNEDVALFHMMVSVVITGLMIGIYAIRKWYQARSDEDEEREARDRVYAWDSDARVQDSADTLDPLDELPFYFDDLKGAKDHEVWIEKKEMMTTVDGSAVEIEVKEVDVKEATETREREIKARGKGKKKRAGRGGDRQ